MVTGWLHNHWGAGLTAAPQPRSAPCSRQLPADFTRATATTGNLAAQTGFQQCRDTSAAPCPGSSVFSPNPPQVEKRVQTWGLRIWVTGRSLENRGKEFGLSALGNGEEF